MITNRNHSRLEFIRATDASEERTMDQNQPPTSRPFHIPGPQDLPEEPNQRDVAEAVQLLNAAFLHLVLLLRQVKAKHLHTAWGVPSWTQFVETFVELSRGKANHLLGVVRKYLSIDISEDPLGNLYELGFFKAAILSRVIDPSNFTEWKDRALATDTQTLAHDVRWAGKGSGKNGERSHLFQARLHGDQIANVEDALELAKEIAESDKHGHLIDLICTTFKADHVFSSSPGTKMSEIFLAKIEKILGVRLVVVNSTTGKLISGVDVLEQLATAPHDQAQA